MLIRLMARHEALERVAIADGAHDVAETERRIIGMINEALHRAWQTRVVR